MFSNFTIRISFSFQIALAAAQKALLHNDNKMHLATKKWKLRFSLIIVLLSGIMHIMECSKYQQQSNKNFSFFFLLPKSNAQIISKTAIIIFGMPIVFALPEYESDDRYVYNMRKLNFHEKKSFDNSHQTQLFITVQCEIASNNTSRVDTER